MVDASDPSRQQAVRGGKLNCLPDTNVCSPKRGQALLLSPYEKEPILSQTSQQRSRYQSKAAQRQPRTRTKDEGQMGDVQMSIISSGQQRGRLLHFKPMLISNLVENGVVLVVAKGGSGLQRFILQPRHNTHDVT